MLFICIFIIVLMYEFLVRNIPTRRNLSLLDLAKRVLDKMFPNYHKDDFPNKKH